MLRLTIWQNCTLMMIWLNRELEYVMTFDRDLDMFVA